MRILFITHHRFFKAVARSWPWAVELARRGHHVTLVCTLGQGRFRARVETRSGVTVVQAPDLLWGKMRSGWDLWGTWRRRRWLRNQRFDLIHAFETRPATIFPALWIARRNGVPLVIDWNDWWGRGGLITELRPRWYRFLFGGVETFFEEHYRSRANATTVISHALADRAVRLGIPATSIFHVQGGVDPAFFRPSARDACRARYGLKPHHTVLGYSAADVTMDFPYILNEMAAIWAGAPNAVLLMTGNKPHGFDEKVRAAGLHDSVIHLGFLPYDELPGALSCCDIFLLPFLNRIANVGRWPHKVGEYMSMARPIVSNPVGDIPALFEKVPIGLLAGQAPDVFAKAVLALARDPDQCERMGRNARELAIREYAWPRVVDRVLECYRSVGVNVDDAPQ